MYSYSFNTELFGLNVEVDGYFEPEEKPTFDCPGSDAEYHIETIKHKGEEIEIDSLPENILADLEEEAFKMNLDEHDPY